MARREYVKGFRVSVAVPMGQQGLVVQFGHGGIPLYVVKSKDAAGVKNGQWKKVGPDLLK